MKNWFSIQKTVFSSKFALYFLCQFRFCPHWSPRSIDGSCFVELVSSQWRRCHMWWSFECSCRPCFLFIIVEASLVDASGSSSSSLILFILSAIFLPSALNLFLWYSLSASFVLSVSFSVTKWFPFFAHAHSCHRNGIRESEKSCWFA